MKTLHNVLILGLSLCKNVLEVLQDVSITGTAILSSLGDSLREVILNDRVAFSNSTVVNIFVLRT